MSGPKHTPAPWRITNYGGVFWIHTGDDVDNPLGLLGKAAKEADAKLIVAAPRLADELSDIAAHLEAYDPQGDVKAWVRALVDYHLPAARAALREAGVEG